MVSSISLLHIRTILSEIEEVVTIKDAHRIRPKLCTRCGAVRTCAQLQKLSLSDFVILLKQFSISVSNNQVLDQNIFLEYDLWRCSTSNKFYKKCDPYTNEWIVLLTRKYVCHTTRSRSSSVASATAELTWSESEPALPGPSSISSADDSLKLTSLRSQVGQNFLSSGFV